MISSFFLIFTCILALYWLIVKLYGIGRTVTIPLPPGPYGIPILGYLPFLGKEPHKALTKLGKKYGSIYSLSMGKHFGVVLNDWKAIKAALVDQGEIFAGRPVMDVSAAISGGLFGIILNDGHAWKEQRRFSFQLLKELGLGKSVMESAIEAELDDVIACLDKDGKKGIDMKVLLFIPVMNVIWSITAGKRFKYDDKELDRFRKLIDEMIVLTGLQDILFMPDIFIKLGYRKYLIKRRIELGLQLIEIMQQAITNHKKRPEKNHNDFIASYLPEIERRKNELTDGEQTSFSETQLQHIALNFFIAGVETTANTLGWGLLYLSIWPEVQEKVHKELDAVYGNSRSPTLSDRSMLPYCNAAIMEMQRMASVLPFSILHRAKGATTLFGYYIPKDSLVIPNLYNLSYDPELWNDPETFTPERFLNEEGNVVKPEYFVPFSTGPRICLGEPIAKMELFILFTNMLHRFKFKLPEGSPKPKLTSRFGVTLAPPDYPIIAERRNAK